MRLTAVFAAALLVGVAGYPKPVWAGPGGPTPAHAPGESVDVAVKREAQQRFRRGLELYEENDFRAALVEFERAYELAPNFKILYNIGQVRYQLRDYAGALSAFERYLQDGAKQVDQRRRGEVDKEIQRLRGRVARITVTAGVSGAEVHVDDVLVGTTPLAQAVVVSAGRRKVTVSKKGHSAVTRVVDVAGADAIELTIELPTLGAPPTSDPVSSPSERPRRAEGGGKAERDEPPAGPRKVPWIAWGVTGALAVGATVTGVMALGASGDLSDKRATPNVGRDELDGSRSRTSNLALATDVLGGAALVAGGVSVWLTFFAEPDAAQEPAASEVKVGVGPGCVTVVGAF